MEKKNQPKILYSLPKYIHLIDQSSFFQISNVHQIQTKRYPKLLNSHHHNLHLYQFHNLYHPCHIHNLLRYVSRDSSRNSYRISANSFHGNYSFLNLNLCTVTFGHSTYRCGNYSREETIQGRKLFAEIRYSLNSSLKFFIIIFSVTNQLNFIKFLPPQMRKSLISF